MRPATSAARPGCTLSCQAGIRSVSGNRLAVTPHSVTRVTTLRRTLRHRPVTASVTASVTPAGPEGPNQAHHDDRRGTARLPISLYRDIVRETDYRRPGPRHCQSSRAHNSTAGRSDPEPTAGGGRASESDWRLRRPRRYTGPPPPPPPPQPAPHNATR